MWPEQPSYNNPIVVFKKDYSEIGDWEFGLQSGEKIGKISWAAFYDGLQNECEIQDWSQIASMLIRYDSEYSVQGIEFYNSDNQQICLVGSE